MDKFQVIEHDGRGSLAFDERTYVVMQDGAFVDPAPSTAARDRVSRAGT